MKKFTLLFKIALMVAITAQSSQINGQISSQESSPSSNIGGCPIVLDMVVTDVTTTSVTFAWGEISGAENGYTINIHDYSTVIDPGNPVIATQTLAMGVLTATFEGLEEGTFYHTFIQADCGAGGSSNPAFLAFNTLANLPVNDTCEGAINVSCGEVISGSNLGATNQGNPTDMDCGEDFGVPGVWYVINDNSGTSGQITVDTCTDPVPQMDTIIQVYTGACDNLVCLDRNDDGCGFQSSITFDSDGATQYYVFVTGFIGSSFRLGNFNLTVEGTCKELGTEDFLFQDFAISPNPAENRLNVTNNRTIETIEVYNLLGQKVITQNVNSNHVELNISELTNGLYLLKSFVEGKTTTQKFIKR